MLQGWGPDSNFRLIRLSRLKLFVNRPSRRKFNLIRLSRPKIPLIRLSRNKGSLIRTTSVWKVWSETLCVWKVWSDVSWARKVWQGLISVWKVCLEKILVWKVWSDHGPESNSDHCPDPNQTMIRLKCARRDYDQNQLRSKHLWSDPVAFAVIYDQTEARSKLVLIRLKCARNSLIR